jgi:DNA-binding Lrp family transcriptional regulator
MFDTNDRRLLTALDKDARAPIALLAHALGMARGTVQSRLGRFARSKDLRPNSSRIKPASLGFPLRAVVTATMRQTELQRTMASLRKVPYVIECLAVSGSNDVLCQIVARDTPHLFVIGQAILLVPGIERTATSVVLEEHIEYRMSQLIGESEHNALVLEAP